AATDTEIEVGGGRIKVTKQRTMAGGDAWSYRLVSRRVGMRHDGSEAGSWYVETPEGEKGEKDWQSPATRKHKGVVEANRRGAHPIGEGGIQGRDRYGDWGRR